MYISKLIYSYICMFIYMCKHTHMNKRTHIHSRIHIYNTGAQQMLKQARRDAKEAHLQLEEFRSKDETLNHRLLQVPFSPPSHLASEHFTRNTFTHMYTHARKHADRQTDR